MTRTTHQPGPNQPGPARDPGEHPTTDRPTTDRPTSPEDLIARHLARPARTRRLLGAVTGVLALLGLLAAAPAAHATAPAPEGDPAWVRVAHLVPDLPTMDVWLTPFDGDEMSEQVLRTSADYGRVKDYAPLQPGLYSVSMRPTDAPADAPPTLTGTFDAAAGEAYTVAGLEESGEARVQVLDDDLTPPAEGEARVRLLPAASSVPELTVTAVGGPTLAQDIAYATPSGYAGVPAGPWQLDIDPAIASLVPDTSAQVDLAAGGVYTLLVLEADGGLEIAAVTDAQGSSVTPVGGAATGRTAEPVAAAVSVSDPSAMRSAGPFSLVLGGLVVAGVLVVRLVGRAADAGASGTTR